MLDRVSKGGLIAVVGRKRILSKPLTPENNNQVNEKTKESKSKK